MALSMLSFNNKAVSAFVATTAAASSFLIGNANADCLSNPEFNDFFTPDGGGSLPLPGSCCQKDVCNIPCPEEVPEPSSGKKKMHWLLSPFKKNIKTSGRHSFPIIRKTNHLPVSYLTPESTLFLRQFTFIIL